MEHDVYMPNRKYEQVTEADPDNRRARGNNDALNNPNIAYGGTLKLEAPSWNRFPDKIVQK
jgi:hypothetical protein